MRKELTNTDFHNIRQTYYSTSEYPTFKANTDYGEFSERQKSLGTVARRSTSNHTIMNNNENYLKESYHDIQVSWLPILDGGGRTFGQTYVPVVREMFGKVGRVYEFCCGPAFIGFSLLAEGLCDSLCLSDVNPAAVAAVNDTIQRHGLQDRVQVYLSDGLTAVPEYEKWDLVVSNPPHFEVDSEEAYRENIRLNDQNWRIHRDFYAHVRNHLNPGGTILFQENHLGSEESTFAGMVQENGFEYIDSFLYNCRLPGIIDPYFYYWLQLPGGGHRMDRTAHPRFAFNEPELLAFTTGARASVRSLSCGTRYRIQLTNNTTAPAPLVFFKKRYGVLWRQALHPIMTVAPGSTTSVPLRLGPGTYQLRVGADVVGSMDVA
jgi:hypothetical protein